MIDEEFEREVERALRKRGAAVQVSPRSFDDVIRAAAKKRLERRSDDDDTKQAQLAREVVLEEALGRRAATVRLTPTPFDQLINAAMARAAASGIAPTSFVEDPLQAEARLSRLELVKHRGTTASDRTVEQPPVDQKAVVLDGSLRTLFCSAGPHLRSASSPTRGFFSNRQAGLGTRSNSPFGQTPSPSERTGGWARSKIATVCALCVALLGGTIWWITKPGDSVAADSTVVVEQNSPVAGAGSETSPSSTSRTASTTTGSTTPVTPSTNSSVTTIEQRTSNVLPGVEVAIDSSTLAPSATSKSTTTTTTTTARAVPVVASASPSTEAIPVTTRTATKPATSVARPATTTTRLTRPTTLTKTTTTTIKRRRPRTTTTRKPRSNGTVLIPQVTAAPATLGTTAPVVTSPSTATPPTEPPITPTTTATTSTTTTSTTTTSTTTTSTTTSTTTTTTTTTTAPSTTRLPTTVAATVPPTLPPSTVPSSTTTTTTIPVIPRTLTIEKINGNRSPAITLPAGTYNFRVLCGSDVYVVAIAYPATPSWTSPVLPAATSSCVVAENSGLPASSASAAAPWQEPLFYVASPTPANLIAGTGYSRTVPLNPSGRTLVIVANRFI